MSASTFCGDEILSTYYRDKAMTPPPVGYRVAHHEHVIDVMPYAWLGLFKKHYRAEIVGIRGFQPYQFPIWLGLSGSTPEEALEKAHQYLAAEEARLAANRL